MAKEEASSTIAIVVGALLPAAATIFFNAIPGGTGGSNLPRWGVRLPILLTCAAQVWFTLVSRAVPKPYLDEIFHIPQAQKYCQGKFFEWDDKITTPPGLYLFSVVVHRTATALRIPQLSICDTFSLRAINFVGVVGVSYLALWCRQAIEARQHEAATPNPPRIRAFSQYAVHTAINIGLFPLIFFFAGLYYTDVLSTGVVLAAYLNHLARVGHDLSPLRSDMLTIVLGIATLLMRQTNVFWVVVFMGGLEAVHAVKTLRPNKVDYPARIMTLWEQCKYLARRYSAGDIHDLPIHKSYPDGKYMIFTALSIGIAALCNPLRVLRQIWPYVFVLLAFAGFVQWNGSVVLGDRSNHVATIHLAQMLYIWPFFAFFSLPLLLPSVVSLLNMVTSSSRKPTRSKAGDSKKNSSMASAEKHEALYSPPAGLLGVAVTFARSKIIWPLYLGTTGVLSLAIVKYNTIVHPFTLADNRHYMFYIFRYTIRRSGFVRLALVLPYTICRWMVWETLGGHNSWSGVDQPTAFVNHPFWVPPSADGPKRQSDTPYPQPPDSSSAATLESIKASEAELKTQIAQDSLLLSTRSVPTSTGLIFLLATSLSLVTAPLVEPRYFILPWVMWRLMVPAWRLRDHVHSAKAAADSGFLASSAAVQAVADWSGGYDVRLFVEGAWHVLINLVTGYIFLSRPYVWRAEDGSVLEGGRLQQFMW